MIDDDVLSAFHLMWDAFPDPVVLIHKNREIVAANPVAISNGRHVGLQCVKLFTPQAHRGCKANSALMNQRAESLRKRTDQGELLLYWLPIAGNPDYLVHVSIGAVTNLFCRATGLSQIE